MASTNSSSELSSGRLIFFEVFVLLFYGIVGNAQHKGHVFGRELQFGECQQAYIRGTEVGYSFFQPNKKAGVNFFK